MRIQAGHIEIEINAEHGRLVNSQLVPVLGLAWPDLCKIRIWMGAAPSIRRLTVWHEIGHVLWSVLNIQDAEVMDEEGFCNFIGLAMSMVSAVIRGVGPRLSGVLDGPPNRRL